MIDIYNLIDGSTNNQIFSPGPSWHVWNKPQSAKMVFFYLLGGGGGGGGGRSSTSNTSYGGGGGGGSSITIGMFQACLIPSSLFIQVGRGVAGGLGQGAGTNGTNGGNGSLSYVSIAPNSTSDNILLASGATAAGGGSGGTTSIGTAGTAGAIWVYANSVFTQLGQVLTFAGQAGGGGDGGTGLSGGNITPSRSITGGCGGGGVSTGGGTVNPGGSITGAGFFPTVSGGVAGNPAGNGTHGFPLGIPSLDARLDGPTFFMGGAGGGASFSTTRAGIGGDASYGCGGGGGGGGNASSPGGLGGNGGRGGDGIVIISSF